MNARTGNIATQTSGLMIRNSDAATLAKELIRVRGITLALFDAYEAADATVLPCGDEFNPPLWELGHIGWFQQWWVGRNRQLHFGASCDPEHQRLPCPHLQLASHGDDWYNSSTMPHRQRWDLPLLEEGDAKAYLAATLAQTLQCLKNIGISDDDLYFFRLVLLHEAMHIEAAVYMAQALEKRIELPALLMNAIDLVAPHADSLPATPRFSLKNTVWQLGNTTEGFSFDNELAGQAVDLASYEIDAQPVRWAQYLAFAEATGFALPRFVRKAVHGFENLTLGHWKVLNLQQCAVHLSWHEAQAYCAWAGRRLPTEAEWECAAHTQQDFLWGQVWEWTSSDFLPYDGFKAHPYRDYSEPWFGSRKVLRGACAATLPIMRNAKYRNYFTPGRTDIYAGFRTCAI